MDNENAKSLSDDVVALKNFLLDIECLDPLSRWVSKFNLFDVLDIAMFEIRHSSMLAWLLDPNENHGLDDSVLRGFIQYIVNSYSNDTDTLFSTLLMSCQDFTVSREWNDKQRQRIDILA
ncbi:MAG: PD-(D/E)XK nuclease family protein, partial [Thermoguttaceae bacterium]|nr:PD-(D/E)XK nuclease family protein [Thermoguttaceae bacterium]